MVRAVVFDLDGTLHDRQTSVEALARDQYERHPQLHAIPLRPYLARFMDLDNRGYTPKPEVFGPLVREFDLEAEMAQVLEEDYFANYAAFSVGFPGMRETLEELDHDGLLLGVVTNGSERLQRTKLRALGIEFRFTSIVISESAGCKKPGPEIYRLALTGLGVDAGEAVMVGDHPVLDVSGPQALGIKAIWFEDSFWGDCPHADAVATELAQVPRIVRSLG
jgi:putative hydrolase of the HAD superfamily